jgi:hypothetical protein
MLSEPVKTITLTQPWATLVAIGAKRFETRSWQTRYRGPLAIHAAKGYGSKEEFVWTCRQPLFARALVAAGFKTPAALPLGAVVATCELHAVYRVEEVRDGLSEEERAFGGYEDGRYAWMLREVRALPAPIPANGALSLWQWDGGPSQL